VGYTDSQKATLWRIEGEFHCERCPYKSQSSTAIQVGQPYIRDLQSVSRALQSHTPRCHALLPPDESPTSGEHVAMKRQDRWGKLPPRPYVLVPARNRVTVPRSSITTPPRLQTTVKRKAVVEFSDDEEDYYVEDSGEDSPVEDSGEEDSSKEDSGKEDSSEEDSDTESIGEEGTCQF